ncbi:glycosyltransferase 87 family protein [Neolewinella antarctica]|uniref:Mannosyltransferase n=1 Tax=Neolewinella antarctica TaxID=442734 RepID=A0ABX0XCF0_9BACT|nr:glycosyltransferase 87 family protein [Neolewinella antarctica]NJC26614.1 hypothetical protein [Neolewinella antarctica]
MSFFGLVWRVRDRELFWLMGLGIVARLLLVFAFPLLSDDVYRFIWDGLLINDGRNPFTHVPTYYLAAGEIIPGINAALYEQLNSPDYFTIYPPVAQAVFTLATWLSPESWYGAAVVMKLFLFVCEVGSLFLLYRLLTEFSIPGKAPSALPKSNLLLYWLNPLIIVEITGNLHFEGAMVFFLLLALYLLTRSQVARAGVAMAAAVASKLLPLLLLPYLIRRLWGRPFWVFSVAFGASLLLFFAPLLSTGFLDGFGSSLDLYFRDFEFNGSLYYLARAYGYYDVGWNQIAAFGPGLAIFAAVSILVLALLDGRSSWCSLPEGWLWAFVIYLLCATTVHPWYLSVPIVLCCFTHWRFPLVWSFLITLTYTSYASDPYEENLWLVGLEYAIVLAFAIYEFRGRKRLPAQSKLT